jgi:outer membrane protein
MRLSSTPRLILGVVLALGVLFNPGVLLSPGILLNPDVILSGFMATAQDTTQVTETTTPPAETPAPETPASEISSLTFEQMLGLTLGANAEVFTAQAALDSATRGLARVQADPLALRVTLLQAEQAVSSAQQALKTAQLKAQNNAADAFAAAREADSSVTLAEQKLDIAQTEFDANSARIKAGAATNLDVERAQNALASAQRDLAAAQQSRTLAYASLASLLAIPNTFSLEGAVSLGEVPDLETALANLETNSLVTQARQTFELAQAQLAAIDNAFSARSDVDLAKDEVARAETQVQEARRSVEITVQQSYNGVLVAQSRVQSAEAAFATAQADLTAQQTRFDAGSISLLDLKQSQLALVDSESQLEQAKHALANSLRGLELTIMGAQ